jgi:hypothetical protein
MCHSRIDMLTKVRHRADGSAKGQEGHSGEHDCKDREAHSDVLVVY